MRLLFTDWLLLLLTCVINSASLLLMRWGGALASNASTRAVTPGQWLATSRWWLVGIVLGWAAGLGWAWCLRRLQLGFALPVYIGIVYILSVLGGVMLLKEAISSVQVIGAVSVLLGVGLLTRSGSATAPRPPASVHPDIRQRAAQDSQEERREKKLHAKDDRR